MIAHFRHFVQSISFFSVLMLLTSTLLLCSQNGLSARIDFEAEFDGVLDNLSSDEVIKVQVVNPTDGRTDEVEITKDLFTFYLNIMLDSPYMQRDVQRVVHEAYLDNYVPFATYMLLIRHQYLKGYL